MVHWKIIWFYSILQTKSKKHWKISFLSIKELNNPCIFLYWHWVTKDESPHFSDGQRCHILLSQYKCFWKRIVFTKIALILEINFLIYYLLNTFLDDSVYISVWSHKICFLCAHSAAFLFWIKKKRVDKKVTMQVKSCKIIQEIITTLDVINMQTEEFLVHNDL